MVGCVIVCACPERTLRMLDKLVKRLRHTTDPKAQEGEEQPNCAFL